MSSKLVENKYVRVQAPCLCSFSPEEIIAFLKDYERYKRCVPQEKERCLTMVECVDEHWLDVLKVRYASSVASDSAFKSFLEEKIVLKKPEEALAALSGLAVDPELLSTGGFNCVLSFDVEVQRVLSRLKGFRIQDRVLCQYYVNGFACIPEVHKCAPRL